MKILGMTHEWGSTKLYCIREGSILKWASSDEVIRMLASTGQKAEYREVDYPNLVGEERIAFERLWNEDDSIGIFNALFAIGDKI